MANDSERNDDRENDQNNNNKKKNGILKPQGKKTDKIEKKMKEIKEQKPHFNEMTGSLNNLLTPVTSRTMTKNTNSENPNNSEEEDDANADAHVTAMDEDQDGTATGGDVAGVPDAAAANGQDLAAVSDDGAATGGAAIGGDVAAVAGAGAATATGDDDERPCTSAAALRNQMDAQIYTETLSFVQQQDGSHEVYATCDLVTDEQQMAPMREISVADGELVILAGDDGVYHRPNDAVLLEADDNRIFVVGAMEANVRYVHAQPVPEEDIIDVDQPTPTKD
ncbi:uncharacterized protein Dsimw501_GD24590 [Drosophila simulans]|nr:uncharacterized protein Dsimw501_GD24590 [Drosophila simulans]